MRTKFYISNLKCGRCAASIYKGLLAVNGVYGIDVNIAEGSINIDHTEEVSEQTILEKLHELGYPESKQCKNC